MQEGDQIDITYITRKALGERRPPPSILIRHAPFKGMLTRISKWSRMQDSFRITPKIESLVVFAILDIRWKFQKDPSISFWVILLTYRQTNSGKNIASLAEVIIKTWRNVLLTCCMLHDSDCISLAAARRFRFQCLIARRLPLSHSWWRYCRLVCNCKHVANCLLMRDF